MESHFLTDTTAIVLVFLGLFLGAVLKGATGAGLPIIAIPAIAAIVDIRVAVVLLVIPNFFTNIWQIVKFREHNIESRFAWHFAIAGFIGAGLGTLLLAYLPIRLLNIMIASVIFLYIALRLVRPEFKLPLDKLKQWVFLAGSAAGMLQGAIGLSSPIAITYLHSGRLPRRTFIYTVSLFFAGMSVMQFPLQLTLGLMTKELIILSILLLIPISIGLPVGERIGREISAEWFDRTLLIMLTVLGLKMLMDSLS